MWGIQFISATSRIQLPLITTESMIGLGAGLLLLRWFLQIILERFLSIEGIKKQHSPNSLDFSYFYHLFIIILVFPDMHWNAFDVSVWVICYVCVGILRKSLYVINIERGLLLNDYAYNCRIITLINGAEWLSRIYIAIAAFIIIFVHYSFLGVAMKVMSFLCFPSSLLLVDSIMTIVIGKKTLDNLVYFYNQNINGEAPLLKL